jgi:hypothetical protein
MKEIKRLDTDLDQKRGQVHDRPRAQGERPTARPAGQDPVQGSPPSVEQQPQGQQPTERTEKPK